LREDNRKDAYLRNWPNLTHHKLKDFL
jgi:hypothetical protein